jgi:uncharacterized membrane protein YoaK (UPF0700 family)
VFALAVTGGLVDAISYLGFARVFTANMTGNTVLLGVAVADHVGTKAARAGTALACFALGVAAGWAVLARGPREWPRLASAALWMEAAALAGMLVWWSLAGGASARFGLIGLSAAAMGMQSAAVRASHVSGVNTTYVTGTLTSAVARAVSRVRRDGRDGDSPALPGGAWAVYGAGAVVGALAESAWHAPAVALPLALVLSVVAVTLR